MKNFFLKVLTLSIVVTFYPVCGSSANLNSPTGSQDCFSTAWPHESSDLSPHPEVTYGRLKNGFRYVILENNYPEDRVGLYLHIDAGSLNETEEQRGAAHYLEHMLFNGSTNFEPGELIEYFQRIGMEYGGDTNAYTTYDETVYTINLPSAREQELDEGLLVMADYARGALLLEAEVDRERGVILAEKRTRDSAVQRARLESSKYSLAGTKFPVRRPIGTLETLKKMDRRILKSFYDAWYRPENMILVVVGDVKKDTLLPFLLKHFEPLKGAGAVPQCPDFGELKKKEEVIFHWHEPDMGATSVSIESIWQENSGPDSLAKQKIELREYLVAMILNSRLRSMMDKNDVPFTDATFYEGDMVGYLKYTGITATTSPENWQKALISLEGLIRQAREYGFSETEFKRVKRQVLSQLQSEVLTTTSKTSNQLAKEIIRSLSENRVYLSAQQEMEMYSDLLHSLNVSDLEKSFQELWSKKRVVVDVIGNTHIPGDGQKKIAEVYHSAVKEPVSRWQDEKKQDFPYLKPFSQADEIIQSQQDFKAIGASRITLKNNIVINLKKTDFEKNRIRIRVDLGGGKQVETKSGMSLLAEAVVKDSGFGQLDKREVEDILVGNTVSYDFKVNESSFTWYTAALRGDEELLFQVLQTLLEDPGFKVEAFENAQKRYAQTYGGMSRNIKGGMQLHVKRFLAGGEQTIGWPPYEELAGITFENLSNWFVTSFSEGRREVSIVGDFDKELLLDLSKKYLGGLPATKVLPGKEKKITFPAGEKYFKRINSSIDKTLLVMAWPTADFWDIHRTRRLNLLSKIFDDRLRVVVREKLGEAYSPVVYSYSSRVHKGYGFLLSQLIIEPDKVDIIRNSVLEIAADLQKNGIRKEELERAKAPTLTSLKDLVKKNGYWLDTVLARSSVIPAKLQWPTTIISDYSSISVGELNKLAKLYLNNQKVATAVVSP